MIIFLVICILIGILIALSILDNMNKELIKSNKNLLARITVINLRRKLDLKRLKAALQRDPLVSHNLLRVYVEDAEKEGYSC